MTLEPEGLLTGIRGGLSRENISARFRAIRKTLGGIPRATVLHYSILTLTLGLAAIIRLLPLRWGAYISEFDPYFNFNDMRQITSGGWQSWYAYTDFKAWFPFGRSPVTTSYPGTSFTGTLIYMFLQAIGINVSLYDAAVYAPVILGVFGVLANDGHDISILHKSCRREPVAQGHYHLQHTFQHEPNLHGLRLGKFPVCRRGARTLHPSTCGLEAILSTPHALVWDYDGIVPIHGN